MIEYDYIERLCPVCNSAKREQLDEYDRTFKLTQGVGVWHVKNHVCMECGFVYANPIPSEESLTYHYSNSFPMKYQCYSSENRIEFIKLAFSNAAREGSQLRYAELGANNEMPYHAQLKKIFKSVDRFDLNSRSNSENIDYCCDVKNKAPYDLVTSYYVLEHVSDPKEFLLACKKIAKNIIIEIPDVYEYRYEPAGYAFHEHLNHFSLYTFCELAKKVNLRIEMLSKRFCSRSFGTAYYLVADDEVQTDMAAIEAMYAKECVYFSKRKIKEEMDRRSVIASKILKDREDGLNVILWCVNELLRDVLGHVEEAEKITVIDSNRDKKYFLSELGIDAVLHPDDDIGRSAVLSADKYYIFSQLHHKKVLAEIASLKNVDVSTLNVEIV